MGWQVQVFRREEWFVKAGAGWEGIEAGGDDQPVVEKTGGVEPGFELDGDNKDDWELVLR